MQQSKLIRQLRILSPAELKRLFQFLKSPFYNANPAMVKLYLLLRAHYPEFDSKVLSKEKVFRKLFPDRTYDHQKLLNLMSDFMAILEQYLIVLQLEKDELEQKKLLLQSYLERPDCYEIFEKKVWELDNFLDAQPFRDESYFQEKKDLNLLFFGHPGTEMASDGQEALQNALRYSEASKALLSAKLHCSWNAWENVVGARKAINLSSLSDYYKNNPLLILYEKLAVLQSHPDIAESLQDLVQMFTTHVRSFRQNDQSNMLKILLNFCNMEVNRGKTEFIGTSLSLYKSGLELGSFLYKGRLKESTFHNIVTFGTLNREFEWAQSFIETYQHLLDANVREGALALAMGQWYCEKEDFEKAVEVLNYSFSEPLDIYKAKATTIRAWGEIFWNDDSYFDFLIAQLDALEKYVRRNQDVTPSLSSGMLKFVIYTRRLVFLKWEGKDFLELKNELKAEPNVVLKSWLLKKAV